MAFCKYCGSPIPDEAEFCPECGKKAPGGSRGASPLTQQESSAREPLSRREFFETSFSPDVKKRGRTNWIALAGAVLLRIVTICVLCVIQFPTMPDEIRMWYISKLVFNMVGVYLLLLLLTCVFKRRELSWAALALSVYIALPLYGYYTILEALLGAANLVIAIVIMLNTNKLEKEYRVYLDRVFPNLAKKK